MAKKIDKAASEHKDANGAYPEKAHNRKQSHKCAIGAIGVMIESAIVNTVFCQIWQ